MDIKPSQESKRITEKIVFEEINSEHDNSTMKQYYVNLMDQLEMDGLPKSKISTVGSLLICERKSKVLNLPISDVSVGSWWYEIAKEKECIDVSFSHPIGTDPERENSSINTPNAHIIHILRQIKLICNLAINTFPKYPELGSIFGEKETREFYMQLQSVIDNCNYVFDEKTKIPPNTEQMLLECISTSNTSISECASKFMEMKVELLKNQTNSILTAKQARKFQIGDKVSQLDLWSPTSRDMAIFGNYIGIQCECGSWRVRTQNNKKDVECYDCKKISNRISISKCRFCQMPLYKEDLKHIVDTWEMVTEEHPTGDAMCGGHCPNCNTINRLPAELIEYAKS